MNNQSEKRIVTSIRYSSNRVMPHSKKCIVTSIHYALIRRMPHNPITKNAYLRVVNISQNA